jgi:hypothetical protein
MAFVAIVLFWVMGQVKTVRDRRLLLQALEAERTDLYDPYIPIQRLEGPLYVYEVRLWLGDFPRIPWYRKILGDRAQSSILLPFAMAPEKVQQYCSAFSEANVSQQALPRVPHAKASENSQD